MRRYKKILFVCEDNTATSLMAEKICKSMVTDEEVAIESRGMVVLFPEPVNPKTQVVWINHGLSLEENRTAKMLDVEVHLSHYGIKSRHRADILITKYNEETKALESLCVIECKAPEIMLGENVQNQMMDYCDELCCDYCMITNGYDIQCFHYDINTNSYVF